MNNNEKIFLVNEKILEGKGKKKSWEEIANLEEKEKVFKILKREKDSLEREVIKKDKEIKELKLKLFKKQFSEDKKGATRNVTANGDVTSIRRIINYMTEGESYAKTKLAKELCMSSDKLMGCINFLEEFKIIKLKHEGDRLVRVCN